MYYSTTIEPCPCFLHCTLVHWVSGTTNSTIEQEYNCSLFSLCNNMDCPQVFLKHKRHGKSGFMVAYSWSSLLVTLTSLIRSAHWLVTKHSQSNAIKQYNPTTSLLTIYGHKKMKVVSFSYFEASKALKYGKENIRTYRIEESERRKVLEYY